MFIGLVIVISSPGSVDDEVLCKRNFIHITFNVTTMLVDISRFNIEFINFKSKYRRVPKTSTFTEKRMCLRNRPITPTSSIQSYYGILHPVSMAHNPTRLIRVPVRPGRYKSVHSSEYRFQGEVTHTQKESTGKSTLKFQVILKIP